jgi:UDP-N-acetylmuramoyl-tripeptide--D-alanyl-D-alanine ligase
MLTIADVIESLVGVRPIWANQVISDAVIDSRQAIPGCIFVALPGEKLDGHDFVEHAFERGAYLAIVDRDLRHKFNVLDLRNYQSGTTLPTFELPVCLWVENSLEALQQVARFWRRKLSLRVIGITGSVGKSTSKELIAEVLKQRFSTLKNQGNLNNEIGLPLTILRLGRGHTRAVLEMGFYVPGEIKLLCDIALPQVGVITNIGTVHAERAGSQDAIAYGKSELVQALPPEPEGVAILNYDDPYVRKMSEKTQAKVFYYGLDERADLWADNVEGLGLEGIRFRLHYQKEVLHLKVPLIGRHSVHTALRATAVGLVEELTWEEIVNGLRSKQAQLRLASVRTKSGALILDDTYNASPQSTLAALNLLAELDGKKVAVLGDMLELGQYERQGHEIVGIRASEIVDELITVGERARLIADAACRSGLPSRAITELNNSQEALEFLSDRLSAKDVVLIKGSRGMQLDQIVNALEIVR